MTAPSKKGSLRSPLRVYLIDAHPVARLGLRACFDAHSSITVVGDAATLAVAMPALRLYKPDVVITDTFPIPKRVLAQQRFRVLYALETPEHYSLTRLTQDLAHGHASFVLKSLPLKGLLRAVRQVATGRRYRDPAFMRLVEQVRQQQVRATQMKRRRGAGTRKGKL